MKLKKVARKLQSKGTRGDTHLVHVNPRELMMLDETSGGLKTNPHTGLFAAYSTEGGATEEGGDEGAAGYGGGPGTYGGGDGGDGDGGGAGYGGIYDVSPQTMAANPANAPTGQSVSPTGYQDYGGQPQGFFESVGTGLGYVGRALGRQVEHAFDNPIETLVNIGVGLGSGGLGVGFVGAGNNLSGMMGGPTVGSGIQGMVNSMFAPDDTPSPNSQNSQSPSTMFDTPNEFGGPQTAPLPFQVAQPTLPTGAPVNDVVPPPVPQGRPQGAFMGYPPMMTGNYAARPWMTGY